MNSRPLLIALLFIFLTGCSAMPREPGFKDVAATAARRTGAQVHWNQGGDADREVARHVDQLLAQPLNADEAVQIALLSNPSLQAHYEQLGVAQADLVQAGLLKNPMFDASVRWPDVAPKGPNVEFAVTASFIDMLFIPARKKIATADFERTRLEVSDAVLKLAAEVRGALYEVQGAQQMLELRRTVVQAEDAAAQTAQQLFAAGNTNQLDADAEQALVEQSKLELTQAEANVELQRERLALLMGISGRSSAWSVAERLPAPPAADENLSQLEERALNDRLDLAAAKHQASALKSTLGLQKNTALVSEAQIGVDTERETDGQRVTGPVFSVPIPLFDLGQARVAAARYRLRQAEHQYDALKQQARTDVRLAYSRMSASRQRFQHLRDVVVPLQHRIVQQSQLHYNAMLLSVFQLLSAKQNEITAGSEYVGALKEYWMARSELERAVGGRLPMSAANESTTQPKTMPATMPDVAPASMPASPDLEHHHHH